MSSYIGTNFLFKSDDFLDDRQGIAKSKDDLKNWDIPVPEGFKLCLDGIWYYYDPTKELEETGHWVPELCDTTDPVDPIKQSASMSLMSNMHKEITSIRNEINNLNGNTSPLSLINPYITATFHKDNKSDFNNYKNLTLNEININIQSGTYDKDLDKNNDGKLDKADYDLWLEFFNEIEESLPYLYSNSSTVYQLEVGSTILPKISWKLILPRITWHLSGRNVVWTLVPGSDTEYVIPDNSEVIGAKGKLGPDKTTWISDELITSNIRKTINFTMKSTRDGVTVSSSTAIKFSYKNYTGSDTLEFWNKDLLTQEDLKNFSSRYTESGSLGKTFFNCQGGKYPIILIPKEFCGPGHKIYVNGYLNSDFAEKEVTVINSRGISIPFMMYRTNIIQTGSSIPIEIR